MDKTKASVYLEKDYYKFLKIKAIEKGLSFTDLVEEVLKDKYPMQEKK